jgi:hypothetical protein
MKHWQMLMFIALAILGVACLSGLVSYDASAHVIWIGRPPQ